MTRAEEELFVHWRVRFGGQKRWCRTEMHGTCRDAGAVRLEDQEGGIQRGISACI